MVTRTQVLALAQRGVDYEVIGRELGVAPALAYLVATGLPADGSDVPPTGDLDRPGVIRGSTQHLANPPTSVPTSDALVGEWMRQRARADGPMAAAARQRTAEPPEPRSVDDEQQDGDVITVLARSHNQVKVLLKQLETVPGYRKGGSPADLSRRISTADMVVARLSAHEAAEEEIFWAAVADGLEGGPAMAAKAREQENEGKRVLDELRKLCRAGTEDDHFDELVEQLVLLLRRHVAFEDSVFLEVKRQLTQEQRVSLGERVARAMAHGPTRPHPHAPSGSGALHVAGPLAAVADKVRDAVGDRPAEREGVADEPAQRRTQRMAAAEDEPPMPATPAPRARRQPGGSPKRPNDSTAQRKGGA